MPRPFDLFEELADVVEGEAGTQRTEISGPHDKRRPIDARRRGQQPPSEGLVHHLPERPPRAPRLGPELGRHIVVKREGCSHIMMLSYEHHDVTLLLVRRLAGADFVRPLQDESQTDPGALA